MTTVAEPRGRSREASPVLAFVGRRLLGAIVALFVASIVIFAGTAILPGDAASVVLGRNATPQAVERARTSGCTSTGRLPRSTSTGSAASSTATSATRRSASRRAQKDAPDLGADLEPGQELADPGGDRGALHDPALARAGRDRRRSTPGKPVDHAISIGSLAAIALPEFVIGSLLIGVFFVWLDWLPPVALIPPGRESARAIPTKLVLPVATLLLASLAAGIRMVRAGMVEVLQTEYVQTARLNGLAERRVLWRYAMRNALAPSVQVLAQNLQWLIGGIIITENVFAYPGIGSTAGHRRREPRHDRGAVGGDADRGRLRACSTSSPT